MYKTKQGECWDEVAKKVYGSEKYTGYLMQNNLPLLDIAVFSAGTVVNTPDLPADETDIPIWRKQG
jgi:phage tail protein X